MPVIKHGSFMAHPSLFCVRSVAVYACTKSAIINNKEISYNKGIHRGAQMGHFSHCFINGIQKPSVKCLEQVRVWPVLCGCHLFQARNWGRVHTPAGNRVTKSSSCITQTAVTRLLPDSVHSNSSEAQNQTSSPRTYKEYHSCLLRQL